MRAKKPISSNLKEVVALEKLRDTLLPKLLASKIDLSKITINNEQELS